LSPCEGSDRVPDRKLCGRTRAGLCAVLALLACLTAPALAQAAAVATTTITFPTDVKAGQSGLGGSITLRNQNNGSNAGGANVVCNAGDAVASCLASDTGIELTPSCSALAGDACAPSGADPGVFAIAPSASGRIGTACAGIAFSAAVSDPAFGTVRFTPLPGGTHLTLPAAGSSCIIDFQFSVLKTPAVDQNPALDGTQTAQATEHTQVVAPFGPSSPGARAQDTSKSTVSGLGTPTMQTQASPAITLGAGSLSDGVTVGSRISPIAGATIDFRLYGPDNPTCAGTPVFSSTGVPYPAGGGTVTSAAFAPAAPGTYRWTATYSGEANNAAVSTPCNADNSSTVVSPAVKAPAADRDKDGVRDAVDHCKTVAGDMRNGCPSLLDADIRGVWRVNDLLSKLISLSVQAPKGSRIEVTCEGRHGACGFAKAIIKKTTTRTTGLTRTFGRTRIFPAGTRITVKVMKALKRGSYERLLTRTGRRLPSVADRCLNPSGKVLSCPR
jgi:hypothetical protein